MVFFSLCSINAVCYFNRLSKSNYPYIFVMNSSWPWPIIFNILFNRDVTIPAPVYISSTYAPSYTYKYPSLFRSSCYTTLLLRNTGFSPCILVTETNPKRISAFTEKGKKQTSRSVSVSQWAIVGAVRTPGSGVRVAPRSSSPRKSTQHLSI